MTLWRVSDHADLEGVGGTFVEGRWHSLGRPIVYCAPNPATSLLEIIVNLRFSIDYAPLSVQYLEIDAPDNLGVDVADLHPDPAHTRAVGDDWLLSLRTPLLRVPSAIVPATFNTLINPAHSDAKRIRIVRTHRHPFDPRLLKTASPIK